MVRRLFVLLAAVPVLLAACGGDDASPLELVSTAGASTQEAGTARMSITAEGGPAGEVTGEGLVDMEGQRGAVTFDVAGTTSEIAFDGTTLYLRLPPGADPTIATEWVSFDLATVTEAATGADIGQLPGSGTGDPTAALALLEATTDEIEDLGQEEVRGDETTHYRAVVDVRKAYEDADAVTDEKQFEAFLELLGTDELPIDVWIDDEGRVRRQSYEQPVPGGAAMKVTFELFEFGVDEPIDLPAGDEVTDVTDQVVSEAGG